MLPRLASAALAATLALAGQDAGTAGRWSEEALLRTPALGPHIGSASRPTAGPGWFRPSDRLVGTYYFFWYDHASGEHFRNADGSDALVDHPVRPETVSYRDVAWHRKELLDLMDAGVDFILPVYWGAPPDVPAKFTGHYEGIVRLVEAAAALRRQGRRPPAIGMFYDTSSLAPGGNIAGVHVDLTTAEGKAWLYVTIRDYFSMVPPALWAAIGGKPIVFLYSAGAARAGTDDPSVHAYVRSHFAADFGGVVPYMVTERSWQARGDNAYDWGAAFGPKAWGVAAVGPGYDDRAVPGRNSPVISREEGARYRRAWERLLAMDPATRPKIAVVETWNELHEGTGICETREYGRTYIELTRRYAARWRSGDRVKPAGPLAGARSVSIAFGPGAPARGIRLIRNADGLYRLSEAAGSPCVETKPNTANREQFLYCEVDDDFYFEPSGPVTVTLECLDEGGGNVGVTYDSTDVRAHLAGAYTAAPSIPRGDTGKWRAFQFRLPDARFANRQNSFTDFRVSAGGTRLRLRRVTISKGSGTNAAPVKPPGDLE